MEKHKMPIDSLPEGSVEFQLGFISGQLRELIHGQKNDSMKLDGISTRVAVLEKDKTKREGMSEVLYIILKSPVFGWVVAVAAFLYAKWTNKI